jgi:DNA helicase HerA-like ATPase
LTTLRIGATAGSPKRIRALVWEVFGSLQVLESKGVRLTLTYDTSTRWREGTPRAGLRLSARELLPLFGWPLGDRDYAGVTGVHPRRLPVAEIVSRTVSVFAVGTAPGPERPIGIDTKSRLQHMVTIGPTGSGKSTLIEHLAISDIRAGRPCVVIEPKKQLVDSVLDALRPEEAEAVVVLDASDMDAPVGFNPLDVGDRDPDIVVDGIVAALAATFGDGWGPRTEYLIHGALLSLARAGAKRAEPHTLIDLPALLTDPALRRPVIRRRAGRSDAGRVLG